MREFTLTVTEQELTAIANACMELPKRIADPLLQKVQQQVQSQLTPEVGTAPPSDEVDG